MLTLRRGIAGRLAIITILLGSALAAHAQYGGGAGTPDDPYLIHTAEHLNAIGADPNDWDCHFTLTADLDLSAYPGTTFNIIGGYGPQASGRSRTRTYAASTNDNAALVTHNDTNVALLAWPEDLTPFTGVFDGNGHTITNFSHSGKSSGYVGLFGYIDDPNATIMNLGLIDPNVGPVNGSRVGALVGHLGTGTISDCYVSGGTITGGGHVGGLVGSSGGTIRHCHVTGSNVSGRSYVGGLLGQNEAATVAGCSSSATVDGERHVGGLVGESITPTPTRRRVRNDEADTPVDPNAAAIVESHASGPVSGEYYTGGLAGISGGIITECYATGAVDGNEYTGGLAGFTGGTVTKCYATGPVTGLSHTGGLVGVNRSVTTKCYTTGPVTGDLCTGGLVGYNWDVITNCYATGSVTDPIPSSGASYEDKGTGGLAGSNGDTIVNCYATGAVSGHESTGGLVGNDKWGYGSPTLSFWDVEATGQATSAGAPRDSDEINTGGTGSTTAQMQLAGTFLPWAVGVGEGVWTIDEGRDYPRLAWENKPGVPIELPLLEGTGTEDDPYRLYTDHDLIGVSLRPSTWDKHFQLMADIDLAPYAGAPFHPIGDYITPFTGTFDGNRHVIANFAHQLPAGVPGGLFGYVRDVNARIERLCLLNPDLELDNSGTTAAAGALVGRLWQGTVSFCCTEGGRIRGGYRPFVGGLVGSSRGTVKYCYSTTSVTANLWSSRGGLAGRDYGAVMNCYAAGYVEGSGNRIAGLVGEAYGRNVTASFWDIEASGQTIGNGGEGRTTAQMQDPNTFRAMHWDFVGPDDGPSDIWNVSAETGYPILWWRAPESEWPVLPSFAGGSGTSEDPFLIDSAQHLNSIGHNPRLMDAHFALVTDIDLADMNFFMIGSMASPFAGVFDGGYRTISNFTYLVSDRNTIGLFSYVQGPEAQIRNLGLVDPHIDVQTPGWEPWMDMEEETGDGVGALAAFLGDGASLTQCFVQGGSVSGNERVGGLVGYSSDSLIADCYGITDVSGISSWAGLVGSSDGTILHCYAAGTVKGDARGGLAQRGNEATAASFWDIEATGQTTSAGGFGRTTAEMQQADTFLGWSDPDSDPIWTIDEGNDYPRLWWENRPGQPIESRLSDYLLGTGTPEDPYLIHSPEQLNLIGRFAYEWDSHFVLMNDIDLGTYTETDFNIIGVHRHIPFTGVFDGNGRTIANFHYRSGNRDHVGLFGCISDPNARIMNLGLLNADIEVNSGEYIAALVGKLEDGTISACALNGALVTPYRDTNWLMIDYVGSLAGYSSGTITDCYATGGRVRGDYATGALVGYSSGTIATCYSANAVSSRSSVGGLTANGHAEGVIASFWDMDASRRDASAGGMGKSTAEMQQAATFLDAGWDFIDETDNGIEDLWWILEGQDYPRLWWELLAGNPLAPAQ